MPAVAAAVAFSCTEKASIPQNSEACGYFWNKYSVRHCRNKSQFASPNNAIGRFPNGFMRHFTRLWKIFRSVFSDYIARFSPSIGIQICLTTSILRRSWNESVVSLFLTLVWWIRGYLQYDTFVSITPACIRYLKQPRDDETVAKYSAGIKTNGA